MRNYLLIILFFLSIRANAQEIFLVQEIKRDLVQSMPNPFSIIGKNCQNYIVSCDNGEIRRSSDCKFIVYPKNIGAAKITIHTKSGKLVSEEKYHVKSVEFILNINGSDKKIFAVDHFIKSARFQLYSNDLMCSSFSWNANFETVIVEDNKKTIINAHSKDGNLDELKEKMKSLKPGNIIIFHKIKVLIENNEYNVSDIVLEII
ncbi:hypothetical protein ACI6PS_06425 [Flavobacterium sp. PLA-1-15]|uniref:hypothetical protein n=1 Tax=Flavobacterium sp. PLA-1-15 TaxID=3380533 RepID=UPI003B75E0CB